MESHFSKKLIFGIFIIMLFHGVLISSTYYVSKDACASDSNDGLYPDCSLGGNHGPYLTIQYAADISSAGDTIYIRNGTYDEKIDLTHFGTNGNPIVFMNYPNESPVIDWTSGTVGAWHALFEMRGTPRHIVVKGLTFQNSEEIGILAYGNTSFACQDILIDSISVLNSGDAAIYIENGIDLTIRNTFTEESGASGIFVSHSENVTVIGNMVINARNTSSGHDEFISLADVNNYEVAFNEVYYQNMVGYFGALGIDAKDGSSNGSIHHNYVHDILEDGAIYIDAYDNTSPGSVNNRVYNNRIENCEIGISIGTEEGGVIDSLHIYNNVIINVTKSGIQIHDSGPNGTSGVRKNIRIYNNTVYSTVGGGWKAGIFLNINTNDPNNLSNVDITNNIVRYHRQSGSSSGYGQICGTADILSNQAGMGISVQKNLTTGIYYGVSALSSSSEIVADPLFRDSTNLDFHLLSGSPAIDTGLDVSGYNLIDDYDGAWRPLLLAYDLGAYEFGVFWTGSTNNDWNNAGNWSNNQIPTASTDVSIVSGATNWPTKNGNLTIGTHCNNLFMGKQNVELSVTGDLTIASGKLLNINETGTALINVGGSWINNGTFKPGKSSVVMNGSSNCTITGNCFFYNLEIDKSNGLVSINGNVDIQQTLTINP